METELRTLRSGLGTLGSIAAIVFGLLGIALAWNVTSERKQLNESLADNKAEIQRALGLSSSEPDIVLRTDDDKPLDGAVVEAVFREDPGGSRRMLVPIIIRNQGKGWSGKDVAIKIYTPSEIPGSFKSTDERGYPFETYWIGADETGLNTLPSGFSYGFELAVSLDPAKGVPTGRYPCLVKFYYGRAKVTVANFKVLVKNAK